MADIDYEKRLKVYHSKDQNIYLMPSPYEADGGEKIGKAPTAIPLHDLRALDYPESPIKAIREK
jgi:hypothetical protein